MAGKITKTAFLFLFAVWDIFLSVKFHACQIGLNFGVVSERRLNFTLRAGEAFKAEKRSLNFNNEFISTLRSNVTLK